MFSFGFGYNGTKLKPQLKMAVSRFQIAANKKTAILKQQMREVAVMLSEDPPREEKARIRAEALIREDNAVEAYEILQLACELLAERIKLISSMKECPADLVSSISTLIWACDRVDISELTMVKKQFRAKYGKKFEENAMNNVGGILNERVVSKLSVQPPAAYLVQVYLERICEQFEVDWKPANPLSAGQMSEPMAAPVGYSVQVAGGTGLGEVTPVITGQEDTDSDIGYSKGGGGSDSGYGGGGYGGGGGGMAQAPSHMPSTIATPVVPVVSAAPYIPPSVDIRKGGDDYEEVDIFVPGIPTAPSSSPMKSDQQSTAGGSTGTGDASYDDLAARFNNLKK